MEDTFTAGGTSLGGHSTLHIRHLEQDQQQAAGEIKCKKCAHSKKKCIC